jgi:8-oxo-dGTP pyrophosphatase MutT (NUDIX family)
MSGRTLEEDAAVADYILQLRKLIGNMPIILCGAGALVMDGDNRVLLQHRRDNGYWGLPSGATELGETVEETARREVFEETGLTIGRVEFFGVYSGPELHYTYPNGDEVYVISNVFITRDYHGEIVADRAETRDVRFFRLDDLPPVNPPDHPVLRDLVALYGGGDGAVSGACFFGRELHR